jgi:hypothetical protein
VKCAERLSLNECNLRLDGLKAQYKDDPDALKDAEKRKEYGKDMCTEEEWAFLYGQIDNEASTIII